VALLTRSDFDSAVKDALRHFTQADLLAGNPLLQAWQLARSGGGAPTPQALQAFLAETAKTLFASERDQRLYRVLELTYLNPAPKQEAAAGRLGLSFSTYRRYLTAGVDRLTEWLWQQEQKALRVETIAEQTTGSATVGEEPSALSQRPRLSIVILPFLNLSQDPGEEYLVDGIGDSLITDLSRALPGSFVISRSTAFTYKGRQTAIRQLGRELGVRYVLEGSVLAEARRVRVNVQLIDADTDEHLWAERFDKERKDILEVQDEIVARLSRTVGIELVRTEAARGSSNNSGDAVDLVMRARAQANDIKRPENASRAVDLFRQALELDPDNVDALAGIAALCSYQVVNLYRLDERDALLDEAEVFLSRAAALAPDHTGVLKARAFLLRARGRLVDAVIASEAVIARNPGEPIFYKEMGLNKLYLGETEAAAEWFRRADEIAPRDPDRWTWLQGLGRALMQMGHDAEAVDALSQTLDGNPGYLRGKAWLAAAEALAGDAERARMHLAEYSAIEPEMTVRRFAEERSSVPLDAVSPVYRRESERILEGLLLAGMPDGTDGRPLRGRGTIPTGVPSDGKNLPHPVSELIGREAELSQVADLIRTHRLVTLIGEGGVGKTRLGIEVARGLPAESVDGVGVVELGPLSDPGLVPVTVATAFGLKFAAGAISAERVANALSGKQVVLVLDNCEHVIDAAANIARVLMHANPAIRVLATSREPLRTEGEYVYRVPPLAVPAESTEDTEEMLRHGAVELFVTRARAADPRFSPDGRIAAVVAAICRRLDGIPLAIELAAARGAALGIEDLASRLDDRLQLLTGGERTAPPRQQTLRATLDWSYELLTESERLVLRRLAIFAGGFTLEAAGAIAASAEIALSDVIDDVANLIAKSLVSTEAREAGLFYRLLETTRAYALAKLTESGDWDAVPRRHAEYHRDLFERAETEWETLPTAEWLAAYGPRIDSVRAALEWAFSSSGDTSIGVALTVVAVPLWMHLSLLDECRGHVERALSILKAGSTRGTREEMRLYAALGASLIYTRGPAPETGAAWTNALEIAERIDDTECQLRALRGLWAFRLNTGEYRTALTFAQRFCSLAADQPDPADSLIGTRMVGTSLHYLGDQTDARRDIEGMLAAYVPPVHRPHTIRFQLDQQVTGRATLARILWVQGFPNQAISTARTNVEHARAIDQALSLCNALSDAACPVALWIGDLETAEHWIAMLLDHSAKHALGAWNALGRVFEAVLSIRRGDVAAGLPLLRTALDGLRETGFLHRYLGSLSAFAEAMVRAGHTAEGLAAIEKALARSERTEARWCVAELLRVKGELLLLEGAQNSADAAQEHFLKAVDWARHQGALSWELRAATSLSQLWHDRGRTGEALELLAPIYDRFTEGFETADLRAAKVLIDEFHACSEDLARPPSGREAAGGAAAAPSAPVTNASEPVSEWPLVGGARAIDPRFTPDTGTAAAAATCQPLDKPSIVVLPFQNLSGDPDQEYFADGMVEEIITALSRIRWLFVIARNSSFSYKGESPDVRRVGRELGVRYVLEGSVRRAGGRLRITAQLINAQSGAHLWADHFDGFLEDVFDFQDKVASSVAGVIEPALQAAETARSVARPTDDLTAYGLYLRAYAMALPSAARFGEALRLLELAIDRDPCYGPALAWAAFCCNRLVIDGRSEDPAAHRLKGTDFARRAVEVAGEDPAILANAAYALAYFGEDIGAMIALVDRALALNPSFARGWHISGVLRLYAGHPEIAIEHAEASLRLSHAPASAGLCLR
jgi:predicted ATPase/TolB-like protein/cytochrome c-type biogenesis protein CcmH/NrfG